MELGFLGDVESLVSLVDESSDSVGRLLREEFRAPRRVRAGREGEVAMIEHGLRVLVSDRGRCHPEVAEHGFGAPATKQLDGTGIDSRAEQGGGPPGAEAAHRH